MMRAQIEALAMWAVKAAALAAVGLLLGYVAANAIGGTP